MLRIFSCLVLCLMLLPGPAAAQTPGSPGAQATAAGGCVVLLHGLGRTPMSMQAVAATLRRAGYRVVNTAYPSTRAPIAELARNIDRAVAVCSGSDVHFVTHSMGGILLRLWLSQNRPPRLGRVVMIAPPNSGSDLVDVFGDLEPFYWLFGPAGRELGTDQEATPRRLPPADYDLGVIAGNFSLNPLSSALIDGADDGTVAVEATRVEGMRDHVTLSASHSLILWNPETLVQVLTFLSTGRFDHSLGSGTDAWRRLAGMLQSRP